ncbi:aldehyde dehydrogenase family protein [Mesorhizobium sp. M1338]|uniref:aldehyde dehydrogenase family protein n=1 Tax=unclassified Mesorhizobium TaxID=325217 RepID=UPI00333CF0E6
MLAIGHSAVCFATASAIRVVAPAISVGNPVVYKHASIVPQCAALFEDLVRQAGAPEGAVTIVFAQPIGLTLQEIGAELACQPIACRRVGIGRAYRASGPSTSTSASPSCSA